MSVNKPAVPAPPQCRDHDNNARGPTQSDQRVCGVFRRPASLSARLAAARMAQWMREPERAAATPGLPDGHLRLYALQIYHEISVDITDIRDIYRYLKVRFYENISCVFQIYKDI